MDCLLCAKYPLNQSAVRGICLQNGYSEPEFAGETKARFAISDASSERVLRALSGLLSDTYPLGILVSGVKGQFALDLSEGALKHFPNQVCFADEVILRDTIFGSFSFYPKLLSYFSLARPEWVKSGIAYLEHHSKKEAADSLYLHRNSLLYRLNKLREVTGIDIDFAHDALLLLIYSSLNVRA